MSLSLRGRQTPQDLRFADKAGNARLQSFPSPAQQLLISDIMLTNGREFILRQSQVFCSVMLCIHLI